MLFQIQWGRLKPNPWRCQQIPGDIWILTVELFGWNLTVNLPEYVPQCEVTRRGFGEPASYYGQQITGKSHLFYCSLKSLLWKGLLPQVPLWICHVLGDIMQTHGELLLLGPRDEQLVILHIPDNVSFLIAPLFGIFLLLWGIMKKAKEPWGGAVTTATICSGYSNQPSCTFCSLINFAVSLASNVPIVWWPLQGTTYVRSCMASHKARIKSFHFYGRISSSSHSFSFQMAAKTCNTWNSYLESEYIFNFLLYLNCSTLINAISLAFWTEV